MKTAHSPMKRDLSTQSAASWVLLGGNPFVEIGTGEKIDDRVATMQCALRFFSYEPNEKDSVAKKN